MKDKYDFSKAERSTFYQRGAKLQMPVYLDNELSIASMPGRCPVSTTSN